MDISPITKQRFSYQEIMKLEPDMTYERLSQVIHRLCLEGNITPVKNSGKTSFFPSVYREYKKVYQKGDYTSYLPEIGSLHPKLSISRYMGRPEAYVQSREKILLLSEFFWKGDSLSEEMSVKERSYDIWLDEKFLESSQGRKILSFNSLDICALNCYYAPESYFYTNIGSQGIILVIENKDTWYSIGKALKRSNTGRFCDCSVAMLVYGEGNKASKDGGLTRFIQEECMNGTMRIYYAGDIDGAGIDIYYGIQKNNPDIEVLPFCPLYKAMSKRAAGQLEAGYPWENSPDGRQIDRSLEFLEFFSGEERSVMEKVLVGNYLIPQEILAYPDYKAMCLMGGKESHA